MVHSSLVGGLWNFMTNDWLCLLQAYKRKTEAAKKEYLKALAAYRASLVSKVTDRNNIILRA